jgi:hypothetical protein
MDEERRGGETVIILGEGFLRRIRAGEFGDKIPQRIKHRTFPEPLQAARG